MYNIKECQLEFRSLYLYRTLIKCYEKSQKYDLSIFEKYQKNLVLKETINTWVGTFPKTKIGVLIKHPV